MLFCSFWNLSFPQAKSKEDRVKLKNLKRYLKLCGYKVSNYSKLFEGCKSMKAKERKIMSMLEDFGIKGNPSSLRLFSRRIVISFLFSALFSFVKTSKLMQRLGYSYFSSTLSLKLFLFNSYF